MKKIIYIVFVVLIAACSNKEKKAADGGWDVTISGKVKFPQEGQVTIEELTPADNPKIDSASVDADGSYSKTLHLTEPGYYRLTFFNTQSVDLVIDRSNITLNVDGNDASGAIEIIGSPDYDLMVFVQEQLQKFGQSPNVQQIESEYQQVGQTASTSSDAAARSKAEARVAELQDQYMTLRYAAYDDLVKDLESRPVNLGMINLLQGSTFEGYKDRYYPFYKEVAAKAIAENPKSIHIKQFSDMVSEMAVTAIGNKAPEISLPDPDGKTVSLSSLKGKYVLVDFWAAWCKPCRAESPYVVKAYKEFKSKGFEVFSVSLDRSKDDWLSAIKEDGLNWTHVSDLKYFESQAANDYNIYSIPFSVLIDPDGVIIAKSLELRGNALQKTLTRVLNEK